MQKGFNSICLMPTNLYGPGDNYHKSDSHVLPSLIKKFSEAKNKNMKNVTCWGDGSPLREFLYVDDLAEACIFAMENLSLNSKYYPKDKTGNPLFWINVGSNQEISIKLGLSIRTVENQIYRALKILKKHMQKYL